jgi:hypothetical protein
LEKVKDYPNEPSRNYIRRFSKTRISIPNINSDEAIFVFIRGLHHHDALRAKLLHKRPNSVQDLLTVAKKWADADKANQEIKEDVGRAPRPDQQNCCRDDHCVDRGNNNRNRRNDNHDRHRQDDFRGRQSCNRPTDNAIKPAPKCNYEDAYSNVL